MVYYPIVAEEVQNMLKNFREAIGSNSNQIRELVGLLEVVGIQGEFEDGSLWNLPKIPRLS